MRERYLYKKKAVNIVKEKEIIELNIEKLTYGGEGLGRFEGMTVFVPDTVAGDTIKAEIVTAKKKFAKAVLKEIITPSEHRVKPFCPLANACGGCQWQHISYDEQLRAKKLIVEECMQKIAGVEVPVRDVLRSDENKEYRCKVQYPVQQTKISQRILAGYYKKNTHEIINVKYCPIQPRIIDEIAKFLRNKSQELNLTAYLERNRTGLIRHFVFRYSQTNKDLLLTIVINDNKSNDIIEDLCIAVKKEFPSISGVLVNYNTSNSNIILGKETELIEGNDYIEETLDGKVFHISAESFFQVNPLTAMKMFSEVRKIVEDKFTKEEKPSILDVYAGSGSFSIFLSDLASKITDIEQSESAIKDGEVNLKVNKIDNISFVNGNAEEVLLDLTGCTPKTVCKEKTEGNEEATEEAVEETPAFEIEKYDVVILDPPRKGCSESVLESIKKLADKYIIYVSCNPSTLARDVKLLSDEFIPEFIQPVDMFCHTYHVESILVLKKR